MSIRTCVSVCASRVFHCSFAKGWANTKVDTAEREEQLKGDETWEGSALQVKKETVRCAKHPVHYTQKRNEEDEGSRKKPTKIKWTR